MPSEVVGAENFDAMAPPFEVLHAALREKSAQILNMVLPRSHHQLSRKSMVCECT